jgi:hypothetical protein
MAGVGAAAPSSPAPAINTAGGAPGLPAGGSAASPAAGIAQGGYGSAIQSLNQALANSNNIYSGAAAQLGQQLKQNQGQVQQNLVNSGLGNSTVAQTMQQAPLQTYNQGLLNLTNAQQQANTGQYDQLANTYSNAGSTEAQLQAALMGLQTQASIANSQQQQPTYYNAGTGPDSGVSSFTPAPPKASA